MCCNLKCCLMPVINLFIPIVWASSSFCHSDCHFCPPGVAGEDIHYTRLRLGKNKRQTLELPATQAWEDCCSFFVYNLVKEKVRSLCTVVWCGEDLWCGVVKCSVVWCGKVWCGVVKCGVVWCGKVWCGKVWCGVVWCGFVFQSVMWCSILRWSVVLLSLANS